jgi:threonine/homoserine/homoserine lactone efflux protein
MEFEAFFWLLTLSFAAAITPGPNNALMASSGATFGFTKTIPHILGVVLGYPIMIFLIALGLGEVFQASPVFAQSLRWFGAAIMVWLAWKIGSSKRLSEASRARPFLFVESAAFQWINPKGWAMAIATTSQFIDPNNMVTTALIISVAFFCSGVVSATAWTAFGTVLQKILSTETKLLWFNRVMASLILLTVVVLVMGV